MQLSNHTLLLSEKYTARRERETERERCSNHGRENDLLIKGSFYKNSELTNSSSHFRQLLTSSGKNQGSRILSSSIFKQNSEAYNKLEYNRNLYLIQMYGESSSMKLSTQLDPHPLILALLRTSLSLHCNANPNIYIKIMIISPQQSDRMIVDQSM